MAAPSSLQLEQELADFRKAQTPVSQLRSQQETQYGLPARRQSLADISRSVLDTERVLKNVGRDVASRARQLGGPVTEAARNRLTSATASPIQQNLSDLITAQTRESTGLSDIEGQIAQNLQDMLAERFSEQDAFTQRIQRQMERERQQQAAALASRQAAAGPSINDLLALVTAMQNRDAAANRTASTRSALEDLLNRPAGTVSIDNNPNLTFDQFKTGNYGGQQSYPSQLSVFKNYRT